LSISYVFICATGWPISYCPPNKQGNNKGLLLFALKMSTFGILCWQRVKLRGWLHEQFSACDLLQIAYAIWCICDLVSYKNHFLSFFCTKSQMRFSVSAIWCAIPRPCLSFATRNCAPNRTANRTANCNTILQHHIATPYRNTISHTTCKR
jgi:hypothetical protein